MSELNIFLDSSALITGVISKNGAAYVLLELGEQEEIIVTISEMVVIESERTKLRRSRLKISAAYERRSKPQI